VRTRASFTTTNDARHGSSTPIKTLRQTSPADAHTACSACMRAKIAPALSSLLGAVFIYLAALRDRPSPPFRGCNDVFREFATGHSDMVTFWASYSRHEHVAGWVVSTLLLRRRTHHMPASSIAALTRGDCCTGTHRSSCFNLHVHDIGQLDVDRPLPIPCLRFLRSSTSALCGLLVASKGPSAVDYPGQSMRYGD